MKKLILYALLTFSISVNAAIPVTDYAHISTSVKDMTIKIAHFAEQIAHYNQQITYWRQQITNAQRAFNAIKGSRGIGAILNDEVYRASRRHLPAEYRELGDSLMDLHSVIDVDMRRVANNFEHMDAKYHFRTTDMWEAQDYSRRQREAIAAIAISEKTFNRARGNLDALESLLDALDNPDNDQKAALDMNSRLVAQNGFLLQESLQIQAIANKQAAQQLNFWNEIDAKENRMSQDFNKDKYTVF